MKTNTLNKIMEYGSIIIIGFILGISELGYNTWQFYVLLFLIIVFGMANRRTSEKCTKEKQE